MGDILAWAYPWIKVGHIVSVISWMAAMFYLPRLFVHHAESAPVGGEADGLLRMMEFKLYKVIMTPAMIATWVFGVLLALTPGVVDWSAVWPYVKLGAVLAMSGVHGWLGARLREFQTGTNTRVGRTYRIMNEAPTVLMFVIVIMVIVRPL
ncbi:MAG: protoporphyrinogen oxidase HemJ [Pseudomonadota bacterium]